MLALCRLLHRALVVFGDPYPNRLFLTKEQEIGILRTLKTHNEQLTEVVISMKALLDAIRDERMTLDDRFWRYRTAEVEDHDIGATSRAIGAQIDAWIAEISAS